jgi:SAM-dependent methyltransferase
MGSSLENRYFLLRDESESRRLNLQHFVYKANIGYLLHPCIPIPSRTESRNEFHLADVGTGTGIWLFDISQSLPTSSHLSAFDISPSQFHVNRSLTPNITFIQHDLLKPFPSVHLQKYDVVHIRLMCLVLSKDEWAPAVQNIMTLLKPGGYLQWVDARLDNLKAYPIADNAATVYADRCKEIVDKATAAMNKDLR